MDEEPIDRISIRNSTLQIFNEDLLVWIWGNQVVDQINIIVFAAETSRYEIHTFAFCFSLIHNWDYGFPTRIREVWDEILICLLVLFTELSDHWQVEVLFIFKECVNVAFGIWLPNIDIIWLNIGLIAINLRLSGFFFLCQILL